MTTINKRDEEDMEIAWSGHARKAFVGTKEEWMIMNFKAGYMAALKAERERSAGLVEALRDVMFDDPPESFRRLRIEKLLWQYRGEG